MSERLKLAIVSCGGRPVTIAEIESAELDASQREIDEHVGLV